MQFEIFIQLCYFRSKGEFLATHGRLLFRGQSLATHGRLLSRESLATHEAIVRGGGGGGIPGDTWEAIVWGNS